MIRAIFGGFVLLLALAPSVMAAGPPPLPRADSLVVDEATMKAVWSDGGRVLVADARTFAEPKVILESDRRFLGVREVRGGVVLVGLPGSGEGIGDSLLALDRTRRLRVASPLTARASTRRLF
jgi:hypothetical protein